MIRKLLLLFMIPLLVILLSLITLSTLNREKVKEEFRKLTVAEGETIQSLLSLTGAHQAEKGAQSLIPFIDTIYRNESIVYIGLFRQDTLVYLLSRFDDYFPVFDTKEDLHIINSPVGKILDIRSRFQSPDGTALRLHIGFSYQFIDHFEDSANQKFLLLLGFFAFISLFVTLLVIYFERRMFRNRLELEKSDQDRERFRELSILTAEIAHEIKNPLNSIYLSFNALEPYLKDSEAGFYRDAIKQEIRRINDIIQSYSDQARDIVPQPAPTDIAALLRSIKVLMDSELSGQGILLTIQAQGDAGLIFETDESLLRQILLNMIRNAQEAEADRIEVKAEIRRNALIIHIGDNGHGIPAHLISDIFKPYISTKTKGMGLGLHIVKRVVRALGGQIELVSWHPGETRFEIEIKEKKRYG